MTYSILAPLPGIFYRRPSPDEPFFVEEGTSVLSGATIGLVEAMKQFFPVEAELSGKIKFLVEDGSIVDTEQAIAEIE